jgi:DNA-binding beta-propeller fold protein YncE
VAAGVDGIVAVPELRRVYASSATDAQQIAVIDADNLAVHSTVRSPGYPDGLAYAPELGGVYVSDEKNGNETIIDAHNRTTRWRVRRRASQSSGPDPARAWQIAEP